MSIRSYSEGKIVADGTEQLILEVEQPGRFSGYVDLSEMRAGDTLKIRQFVAIDGAYKRYATEQYSGVQGDPVIYITPKEVVTRMKVTVEQTGGVLRKFAFNFVIEEIPGPKYRL